MFSAFKLVVTAILILAGPYAFADMAQNYSCLKSLSNEFNTTNSGTALSPLGQPYPGGFFFESFESPNIVKDHLAFDYDKEGKPVVVVNPTAPRTPVGFDDGPLRERKFLFWEQGRVRNCTEKTRTGDLSFLLDTKTQSEKFRVELTGSTSRFTKTRCELIGSQVCYLDTNAHCEELNLDGTNLNTGSIKNDVQDLLKFLLIKKVKAMPVEQQKLFTLSKNLKDCNLNYLQTALTIYKHEAGLVIGNTSSSEFNGNTTSEQ